MSDMLEWFDGRPPEEVVPNPLPMVVIFPGRSGPIIEIIGAKPDELVRIGERTSPILCSVTSEMNATRKGPYESVAHAMNRYVEIMTTIYQQQEQCVTIAVLKSIEQNPEYRIFSKGSQDKQEKENVYFGKMLPRILARARDYILTHETPEITMVSIVLSQNP